MGKMAGVFDIELSTAGVPIDALIASMCRSARGVRLADSAALYAQGEPAHRLFLILGGFVKTSRICEDGTEITIELLKYGDIAGAIPSCQLPSEHEETARAIGDVVERVLARELRAAMEVNPRLAVFVAEYLARSKRSAERRVIRAMTKSVDRRVIETLVELAGSFGARCSHGFALEIRLTQQDIATLSALPVRS
jgi:CRP/FNR family transcriptional regulator, cyclic AMP receptor protein